MCAVTTLYVHVETGDVQHCWGLSHTFIYDKFRSTNLILSNGRFPALKKTSECLYRGVKPIASFRMHHKRGTIKEKSYMMRRRESLPTNTTSGTRSNRLFGCHFLTNIRSGLRKCHFPEREGGNKSTKKTTVNWKAHPVNPLPPPMVDGRTQTQCERPCGRWGLPLVVKLSCSFTALSIRSLASRF